VIPFCAFAACLPARLVPENFKIPYIANHFYGDRRGKENRLKKA
jgi:hypothetical protein